MSKNAHVVDGEASESDSEVELAKSPERDINTSKRYVIAGEAPESDDESILGTPPSHDSSDLDAPLQLAMSPPTTPNKIIYNSLLHQKLWECNVRLRASIEGLAKHTTDISVEKLSRADRTLLHTQESMRVTISNLTLARARLKQMHAALDKANCSAVLPTVKQS